ncbi:hypothetical protein BDB00DRAFT_790939 [Zychaea mexicana]|uniref:uncharacterized protein n=1 Tax=Zychaea mexicana TaxID=64656 RepID=UPI0022FF2FDC|nr:uncharacterized protein BDB00DRAFT_790939 [Zychaea mexicana]KAI9489629.1 hypothetical protein BDB00DRAFT_790939 [Zychaea mexicana]
MPNKKRGSRRRANFNVHSGEMLAFEAAESRIEARQQVHGPPQPNTDRIAVIYYIGPNRKDEAGVCTYAVLCPKEDDTFSIHVGTYTAGRWVKPLFHQLLVINQRETEAGAKRDELVTAMIAQVHDVMDQRSAPVYAEEADRDHKWLSKANKTVKTYAYQARDERMNQRPVQLQVIVSEVIHSPDPLKVAGRPLLPPSLDPETLVELNDGVSTSFQRLLPVASQSAANDNRSQQQKDLISGTIESQYISRKTRRLLKRVYAGPEETVEDLPRRNGVETRTRKRAKRQHEGFENTRQEEGLPRPTLSDSVQDGDKDDDTEMFADAIELQEESNECHQEEKQGWLGWIGKAINRFTSSSR